MSGFFGIVRTDGKPVEREVLEGICESLKFRGPDGSNTWVRNNLGFCYTFLETGTPRQAGAQPVSLAEQFWLTGEVRLDAAKQLATELRANGEDVEGTASDAQLLLHCWRLWGESSLSRISGDFSFIMWDAKTESLFCARDFAGARPFYYARGTGVFCFSNTLQVLRMVPEVSSDLDDFFVRDFLLDGMSKDPERTVWKHMRRLPPGFRLRLSGGLTDVRRFLQLPIEEPLRLRRPEEYLERFRELLEDAVEDRLPQGRTSLYLSGGLDSASVCAMAARVARRQGRFDQLKAFTISWRPLLDDPEPEFATVTARHLGIAQEILEDPSIQPDDPSLPCVTPEPTGELFFGRACRLSRRIASFSRVVLSGDGGDNVLDGQAWPYLNYLWARGDWATLVREFGSYFTAHGRIPPLRGGFRTRIQGWFRPRDPADGAPAWLNEDFARRLRTEPEKAVDMNESLPEHPVHPHAYRGLHSGYWASVLEEEDAGWAGLNLETRAPFLDLRLLRLLFQLPQVPWCMNKELTRRAMSGLLPVEILKRPKAPLAGDPLEASQQKCAWQPKIEKNPPKVVREYVEWGSWLATLDKCKGSVSWKHLNPSSLAHWLKAIENGTGIQ